MLHVILDLISLGYFHSAETFWIELHRIEIILIYTQVKSIYKSAESGGKTMQSFLKESICFLNGTFLTYEDI